ncbi:MAG: hypothetical protein AAGC60_25045 [Acidobacteriota bacterium]
MPIVPIPPPRYHALALAFDFDSEPFDHRHRPMISGFAQSRDGEIWHASDPDRPLDRFQRMRIRSDSSFFLHIFTDDPIDGNHPLGLVISSRPSIEAVAAGRNPQGPFADGPNLVFSGKEFEPPLRDVPSAALDGRVFGFMWSTTELPFVSLNSRERRSFELLVELRARIDDRVFDFKVDPELVIEGDHFQG